MTGPAGLPPRGKLAFLARDSVVYGLAGAFNKAFALVSFPILAWTLPPEIFGLVDALNAAVLLLAVLVILGQDSAVARYFYEYEEPEARQQLISQSLAWQGLLCGMLLPIVFLVGAGFTERLQIGEDNAFLLALIVVQALPLMVMNFAQNILKWTFRRTKYFVITLGSTAVSTTLLVLVMFFVEPTITNVFLVFLISRVIFALLGLWYVRDWLVRPRGWHMIAETWRFALPVAGLSALTALTPLIERSEVAGGVDLHGLGIYAAGAKVALLITLPISAFQIAWGPFAYATFKQPGIEQIYRIVFRVYTLLALWMTIALVAASPLLIGLLAPDIYAGSILVVGWIALSRVLEGHGWMVELGISIAKKSHWRFVAELVMVATLAGGLALLIPSYGIVGAGVAALVAALTRLAVLTVAAECLHPIGWGWPRPLAMITVAIAYCAYASVALSTDDALPPWPFVAISILAASLIAAPAFTLKEIRLGWLLLGSKEARDDRR